MRQPPVVISFTQSVWNAFPAGGFYATAAVSWNAGDLLVAICGTESPCTLGTPGATGLTFTVQKSNAAASTCTSQISTAVAAASGSQVVAVSTNNGAQHGGIGVWVIRGSEGIGNSVEQHTATRTINLVQKRKKSVVLWGVFDFAAAALVAEAPTATTDRQQLVDSSLYTIYVEELFPASASPLSVGVGGAGSGPFSIVGLEVYGIGQERASRSRGLRMR